ncbi:flavin reductase [Mucilaginibacter sp. CSA2-8R]|uniref:flavin reductase family protein n=1 Tax=Mucilaginibacter sp. CSA2-8R TaxID=3141542 RepID=UPI00315D79E5
MNTFTHQEITQMERRYRANFINSVTGCKQVHLLGTVNEGGQTNLAVVNSVFHVGANPAMLGVVFRPARAENTSLANIRRTGEYTLNNILPAFYRQAHQASSAYPPEVSEFEACKLTPFYQEGISAPFVSESSIQIGLKLYEELPLKVNGTTIIIGEVTSVRLNADLIAEDGYVDQHVAGSISVAGLDSYFNNEPLGRLPYAKS